MKRRNAEAVGDVVRQFLREEGLETPFNEYRLVAAWPEVVGQGIAQMTQGIEIRNRVLYVRLSSSVVRNELMYGRRQLVFRLNAHVGAQVIDNIIFS